uniref:Nucleoprotein n=1 Tax=Andes orthohantavirus TaxID=1980456 RepID=UPI00017BAF1B|nr:Chain A, Nucleoprotein [Orthohantavirus andesense]
MHHHHHHGKPIPNPLLGLDSTENLYFQGIDPFTMSTLQELQENITAHEQQLVTARQKLKDAEKAVEVDPDDVNKSTLQNRRAAVSTLETKLGELKRQLADLVAAQKL